MNGASKNHGKRNPEELLPTLQDPLLRAAEGHLIGSGVALVTVSQVRS
jgi:hypothetical protein